MQPVGEKAAVLIEMLSGKVPGLSVLLYRSTATVVVLSGLLF
jgi:hypothetical protein